MIRVLIPTGALGLGFDRDALAAGVRAQPDIIAIDGGSTDSGPHYLGTATSKYSRQSIKSEWRELMLARAEAGVPLVIGTCGTCGVDASVDWMLDITRELASELSQSLKVASLYSSQPAERVRKALGANRIRALTPAPPIDESIIDGCSNIVALAGVEPIQAAIDTGADIVLAGRTTDTAIIAALPLARGALAGGAWHGAKIGECGAFCTTDPRSGTIMVEFDETGFTVRPMVEGANCTTHTVSAHMLYENSDPFILYEPGGYLDVRQARYEQLANGAVRVTGSVWNPELPYTVKLEGSRIAGYQTVTLTILRESRYVNNVDEWIDGVRKSASSKIVKNQIADGADYQIEFRLVGRNSALGELEEDVTMPAEIGVLAIVTAKSQSLATEIAKVINPYLLHHPLTPNEETPTFAFAFSPAEMERGCLHEFCLNHVMELDDPMAAFRLEVQDLPNG